MAQTNICVMDENEILLLVQEDERLSLKDPEPQDIAEAFAVNNKVRVASLNLALPAAATFPAITMVGTAQLNTAIQSRRERIPKTKHAFFGPSQMTAWRCPLSRTESRSWLA